MQSLETSPEAVRSFALAALPQGDQVLEIFLWFVAAVLVTFTGFAVAIAVRRWAQREDAPETFTIQDLRELRARGQITAREFASMRATLLAQVDASDPGQRPLADGEETPPGQTSPPEA